MDGEPPHGSVFTSTEQEASRDALIQHELDEVYLLIDHLSGRADRRISAVELDGCLGSGKKTNLIDGV
jgi:hypothetical protein